MLFCIVGTGRCGTTLLQRMFDMHPDLFVFPETHWLPRMVEMYGETEVSWELLFDVMQRTNHVNGRPTTPMDTQEVARAVGADPRLTVRTFADRIGHYCAVRQGKRQWADKTPDYGYFMRGIESLWPRCRFVHLVRDGIAVADSMAKHPGYQVLARSGQINWCPLSYDYGWAPAPTGDDVPASHYIRLWRLRMQGTRDAARGLSPGHYREERFEDLIAEPRAVLERLCAFVGLEMVPSWVESAARLVDRQRPSAGRPPHLLQALDRDTDALLRDLGYGGVSD